MSVNLSDLGPLRSSVGKHPGSIVNCRECGAHYVLKAQETLCARCVNWNRILREAYRGAIGRR